MGRAPEPPPRGMNHLLLGGAATAERFTQSRLGDLNPLGGMVDSAAFVFAIVTRTAG